MIDKKILNEIDNILDSVTVKDFNCISLYGVLNLMKEEKCHFQDIIWYYEDCFYEVLKQKYDINCFSIIFDFDYQENKLNMKILNFFQNGISISYIKKNKNLYISKHNSLLYAHEITSLLGDKLLEFYNKFIEFSYLENSNLYNKKSVNSNFCIDFTKYGVRISKDLDFSLLAHNYNDEYSTYCDYVSVLSKIKNNEENLFKKIFINIEECPEWTRKILYDIRKKQIEEETKLNRKEEKKQKVLQLKRKIFKHN